MSFANLKTVFYGDGYRRYRFYLIPFSVFRRGYLQPERIPVCPYRRRCGKRIYPCASSSPSPSSTCGRDNPVIPCTITFLLLQRKIHPSTGETHLYNRAPDGYGLPLLRSLRSLPTAPPGRCSKPTRPVSVNDGTGRSSQEHKRLQKGIRCHDIRHPV